MTIEISATDARARFSEMLEICAHEPVQLTRRGQPQAVLLSQETYEAMLAAWEDQQDITEAEQALNDIVVGMPTVPWQHVKDDLGL